MNLIFDFDGTICDSFDATLELANQYFRKPGERPFSRQMVSDIGIGELIKRQKVPAWKILLFVYFGRLKLAKTVPHLQTFSGLKPILKTLKRTNRLSILSSNSKSNIQKFLRNQNLSEIFDFVETNSALFGKHHSINKIIKEYQFNPIETYYIGDEERDAKAAKKAGIKAVSVTWGFESKKYLKKVKPDFLLDDPSELLTEIKP